MMENRYSGGDNLEIMADAVKYNNFLTSRIIDEIRDRKIVVDFGAGIGTFAKDINRQGIPVHCIESDAFQLEMLGENNIPASASMEHFENNSVDLIYSLNVLEHINDDVSQLRQWHGKLKPGGKAFIYVPAFQVLYSSMDEKVGHFRRYTMNQLSQKVIHAGFKLEKKEYVDSIGFLASLVYKLIGSQAGNIDRRTLIFYDRFIFPVSHLCDHLFKRFFGKNLLFVAAKTSI